MDYLVELKSFYQQYLRRWGDHTNWGEPKGCSHADIDDLENELGFKLPLAYKQWLLWMGADFMGVFRGSDCFIDHVLLNNQLLPRFLTGNHIEYQLPPEYLAFHSEQGEYYAWFEVSPEMSENPPIYSCGEGNDVVKPQIEASFTEYILRAFREIDNVRSHNH